MKSDVTSHSEMTADGDSSASRELRSRVLTLPIITRVLARSSRPISALLEGGNVTPSGFVIG